MRRRNVAIARATDRTVGSNGRNAGSPRQTPASTPRRHAATGANAAGIPGARPGRLPEFVPPQLATLVSAPPPGDEWLHEMKFDGYRILCRIDQGRAALLSRNAKDWTEQFPGIAAAAARLPLRQALLDGEIAVVQPNGTTSFQALQNHLAGAGQGQLCYFVFDLLHLDGNMHVRLPCRLGLQVLKPPPAGDRAPPEL